MNAEQALTALNETLESRVAEEIGKRARTEEVLRQAQKMETVGQLSGGIAHDFNNLLQIIHGNLSLLQRSETPGDERWRRAVNNALTGSQRAAALTQRLLAFSRRQPLDPKPVDVNRLITDMTELLHRTLGETITIETHLVSAIPSALVDGNQLENAILNLAINARDAMPRGGRLEIATDIAELDRDYSELHPEAAPGRYIRVAVRDTGEGMSRGSAQTRARAVLLDQGSRPGHRAWTFDGLRLRPAIAAATLCSIRKRAREPPSRFSSPAREKRSVESRRKPRTESSHAATANAFSSAKTTKAYACSPARRSRISAMKSSKRVDATEALALMMQHRPIGMLFTDVVLPGGRTGADLGTGGARASARPESAVHDWLCAQCFGQRKHWRSCNPAAAQAIRRGRARTGNTRNSRLVVGAPGPTRTDTPVGTRF